MNHICNDMILSIFIMLLFDSSAAKTVRMAGDEQQTGTLYSTCGERRTD
jgi:hypothetical protein